MMMPGLLLVCAIFAGVMLALHLLTALLAVPLRRRVAEGPLPPITLLRPVCGVDRFDAETLASSFVQDHPDYRLIFCAARADDPVVPLVRGLIAAHPQVQARLMIGETRISGNPKLNNLCKGWAETETPFVAMADSNLLLPPDYLRELAGTWDPGCGLVTSPAVGIRPEGVWGAVECAFLNTNQARLQLAADRLGFGFAQGKTLCWQRDLLNGAGGLRRLGRDLAEDVASTKVVRDEGRHVRLTAQPFAQPIGERSWAEMWGRQLRWSKLRRAGFPLVFLMEPLNGALLPALAMAGVVLLGGAPASALVAYLALWYGIEVVLARAHGWPMGLQDLGAMLLRDALIPVIWVATLLGRGAIVWRGNDVAAAPKLAPNLAPQPEQA